MSNPAELSIANSNALLTYEPVKESPRRTPVFIDKAEWLTTEEAAVFLRKFKKDGETPSSGAIYMMIQRGDLRRRKFSGRLYFNRYELQRALESST